MGWLGRSLGGFGSQIGEARDINQRWQDQLLNIAQRKAQLAMMPLQMQELQKRIAQMGQPQNAGIHNLPGGGLAGMTFDPNKGQFGEQDLVQGMDVNKVRSVITQMASDVQDQHKPVYQGFLNELELGGDPAKVLDKAQAFNASIGRASKVQKKPDINIDKGIIQTYDEYGNANDPVPIFTGVDKDGNLIPNPNVPPELRPLVSSQLAAAQGKDARTLQKQFDLLDERERGAEARQNRTFEHQDEATVTRENNKEADTALAAARSAVARYRAGTNAAQKIGMASHWYQPSTWGAGGQAQVNLEQVKTDAELARQDAIAKLRGIGKPIPKFLTDPIDTANPDEAPAEPIKPPTKPPPADFTKPVKVANAR